MTSKVRRFLAGAAAACLLPAFLSGCSGQEQQQGAASESGEKITLTIWDNQDNRALGYAVNAYTLEHPNVEIKVVNHAKTTMENLPDEVIERLADAIAQKLSSSALSTKKKVGRPRKNRQEEPATSTTAASVQKAKRGRPKGSRSLHTSKDNHSPSGHAQPDQPSQQQNTLVDSDLVNSMMDLVNNTISL